MPSSDTTRKKAAVPATALSKLEAKAAAKFAAKSTDTTDEKKVVASEADYDPEVQNPLEFPLPLLTQPQIIERYLNLPSAMSDLAKHVNHPQWEDYTQLANTGRAERNVWTIFLTTCQKYADRTGCEWVGASGAVEQSWTFGELLDRIRKLSHWLSTEKKISRGERVVLCFAPSLDFFVAFWACLSIGAVAVPVCPPDPFQPKSDVSAKLAGIIDNCSPRLVLSHSVYINALDAGKAFNAAKGTNGDTSIAVPTSGKTKKKAFDLYTLELECCDELPELSEWRSFTFPSHPSNGLALAFLQYTSGSTGQPKGVMVAHVNIVYNAMNCSQATRAQKSFNLCVNTVGVSWLPTFHDMGLIGFHIAPLLFGRMVSYFSPLDFLADPLLWLRVMTKYVKAGKNVCSGAPPFALELCAKRVRELEATGASGDYDLSGVGAIIVGAEPIRLPSLTSFTEAFAPYGFSANSLMPAFGLAENVLHAFCKMENSYPPPAVYVSVTALKDGKLAELSEGEPGGKWLVSSGELKSQDPIEYPGLPLDGHVLIVDSEGCECDEGVIGEIYLYGLSNTGGYWNNPEATAQTFQGKVKEIKTERLKKFIDKSWLRTGDLAAFYKDQFYVTGRKKDMIIINGANFFPSDIEECATTSHVAVRPGCVVAVPLTRELQTEGLVIVLELKDKPQSSTTKSATGSGRGKMKLSKDQVAMAQKIFKQTAKLPAVMRGPAIRGLARLGAWWTRDSKSKNSGDNDSDTDGETSGGGDMGYSGDELATIERAVRSSVLTMFGIPVQDVIIVQPRTVLKTSSGKVRRAATAEALLAGELDATIMRRTSSAAKTGSAKPSATATVRPSTAPTTQPVPARPASSALGSISEEDKARRLADAEAHLASLPKDTSRPPLDFNKVKKRVAVILAEELKMDADTVLAMSDSFEFDEDTPLDEYGLDSVTAMRIAGRLSVEFDLLVPLSPFMFLSDPTLTGMCKVIVRVHQTAPAATSAKQRKEQRQMLKDDSEMKASVPVTVPPSPSHRRSAPIISAPVNVSTATSRVITTAPVSSLPTALPCILGIGTAVPGPGAPQVAITEVMIEGMQLDDKRAKLFRTIGATTQIERRYSALTDIQSIYYGRCGLGNDECIETRNAIYKREAPVLARAAAEKAIEDWGGDRSTITHVIAVTCTGVIVPGLELSLMFDLGLSTAAQRVSLQFMGCFGALSGMKTAKAFAAENPVNRVLLVCCELCSLHMQLDDRIDNLVGSALFADGAGAMIVGQPFAGETPLYEMHATHSLILPNTGSMMAWELTATGMSIGLGKEIPTAIYSSIDDFACQLMERVPDAFELDYNEMKWAIHPGGAMIIEAIVQRLGITHQSIEAVWTVLRNFGNMSSATLVFVLHEMRKQPMRGVWVPSLAFGPGLNIEGAMLRAADGPKQTVSNVDAVAKRAVSASTVSAGAARPLHGNHTGLM